MAASTPTDSGYRSFISLAAQQQLPFWQRLQLIPEQSPSPREFTASPDYQRPNSVIFRDFRVDSSTNTQAGVRRRAERFLDQ